MSSTNKLGELRERIDSVFIPGVDYRAQLKNRKLAGAVDKAVVELSAIAGDIYSDYQSEFEDQRAVLSFILSLDVSIDPTENDIWHLLGYRWKETLSIINKYEALDAVNRRIVRPILKARGFV